MESKQKWTQKCAVLVCMLLVRNENYFYYPMQFPVLTPHSKLPPENAARKVQELCVPRNTIQQQKIIFVDLNGVIFAHFTVAKPKSHTFVWPFAFHCSLVTGPHTNSISSSTFYQEICTGKETDDQGLFSKTNTPVFSGMSLCTAFSKAFARHCSGRSDILTSLNLTRIIRASTRTIHASIPD